MRDLTKWPRLLVKGEKVTEEQADEILIRTCVPAYLRTNDKAWHAMVIRVLGFKSDDPPREMWADDRTPERIAWFKERWAFNDARSEELGIIGLAYLYNSQISSSWYGGPHGWCDWDGNIFCNTHNIGKWPSSEDVTEEWTRIAEVFPFLDLTAQLITNEGGYGDEPGELAGEWRVKDGVVTYEPEPVKQIMPLPSQAEYDDFFRASLDRMMDPHVSNERGVSEGRLMQAVACVEAKMAKEE
jgi:hypothetical protein